MISLKKRRSAREGGTPLLLRYESPALKSYFLVDICKLGAKMFCKSYIFFLNGKKKIGLILWGPTPPPHIFFPELGFFNHFGPHNCPKNSSKVFFWKSLILYKVCTIFWYQVYPNRIKIKETMHFSFFYFFFVRICFFHKKIPSEKNSKIITETLFFIRFGWIWYQNIVQILYFWKKK